MRKSTYANVEGDDPRELAFEAIAEARPRRVLEVGGGEGELAERVLNELGAELVDLDRSLAELARVLKPNGRLVPVTSSTEHFQELWKLAGAESPMSHVNFRSENGGEILEQHFEHVERRDARGAMTMDPETIRRFAESAENLSAMVAVAERGETVRVRTHSAVFVVEGPA